MSPVIEVVPMSTQRRADYLEFFDHRAFSDNAEYAGCYCYFPLHDPGQGAWEDRDGTDNRAAICECIDAKTLAGYLAYRDGQVVGWCHAAPRHLFPTLSRLPGNAETSACVPCFVVAPDARGQGVAAALLAFATEDLANRGIELLMARALRGAITAAHNAGGPLSMFEAAGFTQVFEDEQQFVYLEKPIGKAQ